MQLTATAYPYGTPEFSTFLQWSLHCLCCPNTCSDIEEGVGSGEEVHPHFEKFLVLECFGQNQKNLLAWNQYMGTL